MRLVSCVLKNDLLRLVSKPLRDYISSREIFCKAENVENFQKSPVKDRFYDIGLDLRHIQVQILSGLALKSGPDLVLF